MLADYQITVINHRTGGTLEVFSGEQLTLKYSKLLNDIGTFSLSLPFFTGYDSLFQLDNFVEVARSHPITGALQVEETFLVRFLNPMRDGNDELLVIGGVSLNHLIGRRVVDPDDDPLRAGGYSTKAGDAAVVMRAYAREQMGDLASPARQTPGVIIPPGVSSGVLIGDRLRLENLFTKMQDFAHRSGVDFRIQRLYDNILQLDILPIGFDMSRTANDPGRPFVYLATERGNLNQPSLSIDRRDEQNFVYVQGQGQGSARYLYKIGDDSIRDSLYNRIEFTTDASNSNNDPLLIAGAGLDSLREKRSKKTLTFQPTGEEAGAVYRADWDIGDTVTAAWEDFEEDFRVTGVEITLTDQDEQVAATLEPR